MKTYRIEIFGYLRNSTNLVHLFGVDNLSLEQVMTKITELNESDCVYRIEVEND